MDYLQFMDTNKYFVYIGIPSLKNEKTNYHYGILQRNKENVQIILPWFKYIVEDLDVLNIGHILPQCS